MSRPNLATAVRAALRDRDGAPSSLIPEQLPLALATVPRRPRSSALRAFRPRLESPAEALAGEARAVRQEAAILGWFLAHPGRHAPSEVADAFPRWPVTSVRRALTCMTRRGLLRHHREDRRPGPLGARESVWSAT